MPSTFSGLNTVMRGITAQQVALNTVGHNVSNANTDGYSRQSVNLVAAPSETIYGSQGAMQVGSGVTITSITRIRDAFMDSQNVERKCDTGFQHSTAKFAVEN